MANLKIDYLELQSQVFGDSKDFFAKSCGWSYVDYGPDYSAIEGAGLDGGIEPAEGENKPPLVVLKTDDINAAYGDIKAAGGVIVREIFEFPGGRRFHFREPGGNELAVWSE